MSAFVQIMWFRTLAIAIASALLCIGTAQAWDRSVFDNLDYGIYWYQNQLTSQKAASGTVNPYYSSTAPTMIYIHGWQNGKTPLLYRETFDRQSESGIAQDLTTAWKQRGWNMGIFYWNQFSDESEVKDAEAKLWATQGPKQMRWRKADGSYVDSGITKTVGELFLEQYKIAMSNYSGNDVRLVGHSLGSQAVVIAAKLISDAVDRGELPAQLRPKRIMLLDAAFIGDARPYLNNQTTAALGSSYVDALKLKGVVFESLSTSSVSMDAPIKAIMNKMAYRELKPWYFGPFDVVGKHLSAVWHYFWEFGLPLPAVTGTASYAPSAASSNAQIQTHMNGTLKHVHDQGAWTKTPADDNYKAVTR
jgi:uncharacterized protein YjdB